jgi:hypothetical protein
MSGTTLGRLTLAYWITSNAVETILKLPPRFCAMEILFVQPILLFGIRAFPTTIFWNSLYLHRVLVEDARKSHTSSYEGNGQ